MPDVAEHAGTCATCGAELASAGDACAVCAAAPASDSEPCEPAPLVRSETSFSVAAKVGGVLVYLVVGLAAVYFSFPFFAQGDWWFGMMGIGLALVALVGIKQSLFPKEWTEE